ncbi:MAG: hypothetical protein NT075_23910 [Chloroflexi bacterium]|nr:hypothetical protein [Chloroflexota bacterium]
MQEDDSVDEIRWKWGIGMNARPRLGAVAAGGHSFSRLDCLSDSAFLLDKWRRELYIV